MASKRSAGSDLNHDNWDQEDTPEEAGTFTKASEDVLKKRVFKSAKRRIPKSTEEGSLNVFNPANLALLTSKSSLPASQLFGQLLNVKTDLKTNGIGEKSDNQENVDQVKTTSSYMFGTKIDKPEIMQNTLSMGKNGTENNESKNTGPMFSFGNTNTKIENKFKVTDTTPSFSFVVHNKEKLGSNSSSDFIFDSKKFKDVDNEKATNNLDNYYSKLKGLNQSVAKWINKHVECNPLINLQPIFKDYEKFFDEIEKEQNTCGLTPPIKVIEAPPQVHRVQKESEEKPVLSSSFVLKPPENKVSLPQSAATFRFGITTTSDVCTTDSTPKFSFVNTNTTSTGFGGFKFSTSAPINFGNVPTSSSASNEENKNDEESDEPPKLEVKQVEEEGHIYTIRCKLFVKKDGNFVEKGIGSLFLKPVPGSDKVQLIIRAHNSLGNVLCNIILSKSIPTQRMGKNNVMIVCIPTPESQPQPVPVLIKVKTGEDADQLLETLEKHKK